MLKKACPQRLRRRPKVGSALLQAGTVYVNVWGSGDPAAPFGGYKASGLGREMGHANLDAYLEIKTVWTNLR